MAIIFAKLEMKKDETVLHFKRRCSKRLATVASKLPPTKYPKIIAVGRFAMEVSGMLVVSCGTVSSILWGLAYSELPSKTCYIAGYTKEEEKLAYLKVDKTELR